MEVLERPEKEQAPAVTPARAEIVLSEESTPPVTVRWQAIDTLLNGLVHGVEHVSLKEAAAQVGAGHQRVVMAEFERMSQKQSRFGQSAVYLNRLSQLAMEGGATDVALNLSQEARQSDGSAFYQHRYIDGLLSVSDVGGAREVLNSLCSENDVLAKLRLAAIRMRDLYSSDGRALNPQLLPLDIVALATDAVAIDPLDFNARMFSGGLSLLQGKPHDAIHHFRAAEETRPYSSHLRTNLGIAYAMGGYYKKAIRALQRAVHLDPLNENAAALLADLAHHERKDAIAVKPLQYLVRYEQKDATLWSRLGRAYIECRRFPEAKQALAHELLAQRSSSVYNNLGCVLYHEGQLGKATDAFLQAAEESSNDIVQGFDDHQARYFLAIRNACQVMAEKNDWLAIRPIADAAIARDTQKLAMRDSVLSDIYSLRLCAESEIGDARAACLQAQGFVTDPSASQNLRATAVSALVSVMSLDVDVNQAADLAERFLQTEFQTFTQIDRRRRQMLVNNLVFALVESGRVEKAREYVPLLSGFVHEYPYPTATLGLYHLRLGHEERARDLYLEAARLCKSLRDKRRIKMKWHYEAGVKALTDGRSRTALYYLSKAQARAKDVRGMAPRVGKALIDARRSLSPAAGLDTKS